MDTKMKITKRQLKRIIKEEIETLEYELFQDVTEEPLDADHPEEVAVQRDSWAGGSNIHSQIDHGDASGGGPNTRGQEVMKVTESQLRRIIREAISGVSVRTQVPFIDTVTSALQAGDPVVAANAVMDSFMIDDTFVEEEDALIDALGGLPYGASAEQIEMAADAWLKSYRAGDLRP
jgi:hypothetical protein